MCKLGDQARNFRDVFGQECMPNISNYGFIKKKLWDMQIKLVAEEAHDRADGKVLKGPNYKKPDLTHCFPHPNLNYDTHGK